MKFIQSVPILLFIAACSGGSVEGMLTPAQRHAVEDFLRDHPNAELVQTSACTNPDLEKYIAENPDYRPYFAEEDFNHEGSLDFVVATKSMGAYDLWLFPGSGIEYGAPQNFATITWLHEAGFIVRDRNLFVGSFYSEEGNFYSWSYQTRRFGIVSTEMP